jgi:phosphohistidine swiveling domain-containing protein
MINPKDTAWEPNWAGNWCLLTASLYTKVYTDQLAATFGAGYTKAIVLSKQDYSSCYLRSDERERFATRRIEQVATTPVTLQAFTDELVDRAQALMAFCDELTGQPLTVEQWTVYEQRFCTYFNLHITPRHVIDFLPADRYDEALPILEQVRKDVEPVLVRTEEYVRSVSEELAGRWSIDPHLIRCLLAPELRVALVAGDLPDRAALTDRSTQVGLIATAGQQRLAFGQQLDELKEILDPPASSDTLRGKSAYPGVVRGTARVIFTPSGNDRFKPGDILVTGMTRPEFLPLMHRAGAVVTDAGGVLSHAAITARELKLPTVLATRVATRDLKDGDLVEVDATNGIVRKLS